MCEVARSVAGLWRQQYSQQMEKRGSLHGLEPSGEHQAVLMQGKPCVRDPCVWPSLWYYLGKAGAQAQPITCHPSCFIGLLSVFNTQATAHIFFCFLNARFPYVTPMFVQAQEFPVGGWGGRKLCLSEGDLKAAEEAGHSYLVYSMKKKIKMFPVFVSLPLLFY